MKPVSTRWAPSLTLFQSLLLSCALMLLCAVATWATSSKVFSGCGTAWGATNAWYIVPAVADKVPVVQYIQVSSDLTAARLTFFSNSSPAYVYADSSGTNIHVLTNSVAGEHGTNGFAAGAIIVVRHGNTPNDTYERLRVHSVGTTNISVTTALAATLTAGEFVWRVGTNAVICGCTNSATGLSGQYIQSGMASQPMLIDLDGAATAIINAVGGEFK